MRDGYDQHDAGIQMSGERESLKPVEGANRAPRRRLGLKGELILASLPTLIVLVVLALVEVLSRQRLLFASLASSAFLIYLDPFHGMNTVRALVGAQLLAALTGLLTFWIFGHSYVAAANAMIVTIVLMVLLDMVHPPAVGTALSFAFQTGAESTLVLFMLALSITAVLVILERVTLWLLARLSPA